MQFYCSEHMQNRELNTCKQDIYSFLHFLLPTNTEPNAVRDLGITVCADNLVLKNPKPRYIKPCKPVGNGWLVNTCSDTPTKYEQIKYISDKLSLNLSVEITN